MADTTVDTSGKNWVTSGVVKHPAMFGFGPGIEQNTHKIGEAVDICVNGTKIATGEIQSLDDDPTRLGVRIVALVKS